MPQRRLERRKAIVLEEHSKGPAQDTLNKAEQQITVIQTKTETEKTDTKQKTSSNPGEICQGEVHKPNLKKNTKQNTGDQNKEQIRKALHDSHKRKRPNEKPEHGRKHAFVYGNYEHYYGYRCLLKPEVDPRLQYLKKEWFEGRDCLDVGCNAGNVTIQIAQLFRCRSILGIDIDPALVSKAEKFLHRICKSSTGSVSTESEVNANVDQNRINTDTSNQELLQRVSFKAQNFVQCVEAEPTYDTILCLSVTKWVHLNWGDCGLIRLFAKIRSLLRPGGIFVLEPQPWKSYKSNRLVSEVTRKNFEEIMLHPPRFKEILLERIGFRSMENVTDKVMNSTKGFNRPIFILRC